MNDLEFDLECKRYANEICDLNNRRHRNIKLIALGKSLRIVSIGIIMFSIILTTINLTQYYKYKDNNEFVTQDFIAVKEEGKTVALRHR